MKIEKSHQSVHEIVNWQILKLKIYKYIKVDKDEYPLNIEKVSKDSKPI